MLTGADFLQENKREEEGVEECKSFNASDFMVKAASLMAGNTTEISTPPLLDPLHSRTSLATDGGNLCGVFTSGTCSVVTWGGDATLCLPCRGMQLKEVHHMKVC